MPPCVSNLKVPAATLLRADNSITGRVQQSTANNQERQGQRVVAHNTSQGSQIETAMGTDSARESAEIPKASPAAGACQEVLPFSLRLAQSHERPGIGAVR